MENKNLISLGGRLYGIYRHANHEDYPINRDFINDLDKNKLKILINSFVSARAQLEREEYEGDHIETFWAMYNELE